MERPSRPRWPWPRSKATIRLSDTPDLKTLHAKIGQLTLENDFIEGALTKTTDFCVDAVQDAVTRYGSPEIFNTDQGRQFTSQEFTGFLKDRGIQVSRDGTGRWRDNVFVERLWRSLTYEEVYLHCLRDRRRRAAGGGTLPDLLQ